MACAGSIGGVDEGADDATLTSPGGAGGSAGGSLGGAGATPLGVAPASSDAGPTGGAASNGRADGGVLPVAAPSAPVYCDAPTLVLTASCGNGSCHSNGGVVIGDFAVSAERAAAYVDRVSAKDATCGRIIDSRDYSQSLLLTKVTGDFLSPKCGGAMPVGSFAVLSQAQIDCLASWLQQFQR
jgi:hypothetical protein